MKGKIFCALVSRKCLRSVSLTPPARSFQNAPFRRITGAGRVPMGQKS